MKDAERTRDAKPEREATRRHIEPRPAETAEQPVPGIEHKPEPDAENLVPAKDKPGTL